MRRIIKFLIILVLFTFIESNNKFTILLLGEVGSGRSSFINKFYDKRIANVGGKLTPSYSAMTQQTTFYSNRFVLNQKIVNLIDTRGFELNSQDDNKIFFNIHQTFLQLLAKETKLINSIFIFFPLNNEINSHIKLKKQIEMLKLFLGKEFNQENILIIPNKRQRITPSNVKFLEEIKMKYGINFIHFNSDSEDEMEVKVQQLLNDYMSTLTNKNKIVTDKLLYRINCLMNNKNKISDCFKEKKEENKYLIIMTSLFDKIKSNIIKGDLRYLAATFMLIIIPFFFIILQKLKNLFNNNKIVEEEDYVETIQQHIKEEEKEIINDSKSENEFNHEDANDAPQVDADDITPDPDQIEDLNDELILSQIEDNYEIIN